MKKTNFAEKNPELVKEWHPTKNGNLTPYDEKIKRGLTPNNKKPEPIITTELLCF